MILFSDLSELLLKKKHNINSNNLLFKYIIPDSRKENFRKNEQNN